MTARKPPKTPGTPGINGFKYREQYGVIVVLANELAQQKAFNKLKRMGYKCKVVTV